MDPTGPSVRKSLSVSGSVCVHPNYPEDAVKSFSILWCTTTYKHLAVSLVLLFFSFFCFLRCAHMGGPFYFIIVFLSLSLHQEYYKCTQFIVTAVEWLAATGDQDV